MDEWVQEEHTRPINKYIHKSINKSINQSINQSIKSICFQQQSITQYFPILMIIGHIGVEKEGS